MEKGGEMKIREWKTLDGKTWSLVEYNLTFRELIQTIYAIIMAFLIGKYPAYYMSSDLEELHCNYIPTRHKVIKLNVGIVGKEEK